MESNLPLVPATNFAKHKIQIKLIKEKTLSDVYFTLRLIVCQCSSIGSLATLTAAVCSAVQCSGSQFVSCGPVHPQFITSARQSAIMVQEVEMVLGVVWRSSLSSPLLSVNAAAAGTQMCALFTNVLSAH